MSIFRKKREPDTSQSIRVIRFAIEDEFYVPGETSDAMVEAMIKKIAKKRNFIWTDVSEVSLFDYEDEAEEQYEQEEHNTQNEYKLEGVKKRNQSVQ